MDKAFVNWAGGTKPKIMSAIVLWLFGSIASIVGLCLSLKYRQMSVGKMLTVYLSYTTQFIYLHRRVGQFSNLLMVCHPLLFMFLLKFSSNLGDKRIVMV